MQIKRAFISTPFNGIKKAMPYMPPEFVQHEAKQIATRAARYVRKELGYLPFSPVLAYAGVYDEFDVQNGAAERNAVMTACKLELAISELLIIVDCPPYSDHSKGMKAEEEHARSLGLPIHVINLGS